MGGTPGEFCNAHFVCGFNSPFILFYIPSLSTVFEYLPYLSLPTSFVKYIPLNQLKAFFSRVFPVILAQ